MSKGIFVTGTNTGVGKTVIARALARAFRRRGLVVRALKPVETGAALRGGRLYPADALALLQAAEMRAEIEEACCYCFTDPVSPHLAAARSDVEIDEKRILDLLTHQSKSDVTIAEGAGGLLVPLSATRLYADVIAETHFSLIIVAPDVLGTINSTLLTIEAARSRGIEIAGVVLNRAQSAELGNAEAIAEHGLVRILGRFPELVDADDDVLAACAEAELDLDRIMAVR